MLKWAEDGTLTVFGNRLVFTASHLINMKVFDGFVTNRDVALYKAIDACGHEVVNLNITLFVYQNFITTVPALIWYVKCGQLLKNKPVHGNKGLLKASSLNFPGFLCVGMVWFHAPLSHPP